MGFKEIDISELQGNFINMINKEWMLVAAGNSDKFNMMTASWGSLGQMWGKPVAVCVVRPQRYTIEFLDNEDYFTLTFYGDEKKIHGICGKKSGRDVDKAKETGLVPVFDSNSVYFEQARVVIICKKIYKQQVDPACFIDKSIEDNYDNDYHFAFVGEIEKVLIKE